MSDEYSLSNVLDRMYQNQLSLEAALMELTLHAEQQGWSKSETTFGVPCGRLARTPDTLNRV